MHGLEDWKGKRRKKRESTVRGECLFFFLRTFCSASLNILAFVPRLIRYSIKTGFIGSDITSAL